MSLSLEDFTHGCRFWEQLFRNNNDNDNSSAQKSDLDEHESQGESATWEDVQVLEEYGQDYLRIMRVVKLATMLGRDSAIANESAGEEDQVTSGDVEDMEEVLRPVTKSTTGRHEGGKQQFVLINYDIVHSPIYQVPVLYLTGRIDQSQHDRTPRRSLPPNEIFDMLVPQLVEHQLGASVDMGALSLTDHPVSNLPCLFIHPCRTGDAMQELVGEKTLTPERYLAIWIGLVGQYVGLSIPSWVAARLNS